MLRQFIAAAGLCAAFLAFSTAASAQTDSKSGCSRDVARMCRSVMNDGDMAVLACLKENRARLSKTCQKVLADNNQ